MKSKHYPLIALLFLLIVGSNPVANSQVYHEVSVMVGPVSFRGDYGLRRDFETIKENIAVGFGFNHYLNFGYSDFINQSTRQHIKVRSSLIYYKVDLRHYGALAEKDSPRGLQLRNMFGEANVIEIGSGLEYYLMRIRDYERNPTTFTPYAGIGFNLVSSSPVVGTTLGNGQLTQETTFPTFWQQLPDAEPGFSNDPELILSTNFQVGAKFKIDRTTDIFAELRWHYYFSDYVDGLKPIGPQNKYDDWAFWLAVGYIYNFD